MFNADHSARFGLITFGGYCVVVGGVVAFVAWRRLGADAGRPYVLAQGGVSIASGIAALTLAAVGSTAGSIVRGGVGALLLLLTTWAALTGALELYAGIRARGRHAAATDWLTVGTITAVAALIFVLMPSRYHQDFAGPDGVSRVLDAAVVVVGLLGAYAAIVAVYLLVAGFSAKWGTRAVADPAGIAAKGEDL